MLQKVQRRRHRTYYRHHMRTSTIRTTPPRHHEYYYHHITITISPGRPQGQITRNYVTHLYINKYKYV